MSKGGSLFSRRQLTWIIYLVAIAVVLLSSLGPKSGEESLRIDYQQGGGLGLYRLPALADSEAGELRLLFRAGWRNGTPGQSRLAFDALSERLQQDQALHAALTGAGISLASELDGERALVVLRWNRAPDGDLLPLLEHLTTLLALPLSAAELEVPRQQLKARALLKPAPLEAARHRLLEAMQPGLPEPLPAPGKGDLMEIDALQRYVQQAYSSSNLVLTLQGPASLLPPEILSRLVAMLPRGLRLPPQEPTPSARPLRASQPVSSTSGTWLLARSLAGRESPAYPQALLVATLLGDAAERRVGPLAETRWYPAAGRSVLLLRLEPGPAADPADLLAALADTSTAQALEQAQRQLLDGFRQQRRSLEGRGHLLEAVALEGLPLDTWRGFEATIAAQDPAQLQRYVKQQLAPDAWSWYRLQPLE